MAVLENKLIETGMAAKVMGVSVTALKSAIRNDTQLEGMDPTTLAKKMTSGSTIKYFFRLGDLLWWKQKLDTKH